MTLYLIIAEHVERGILLLRTQMEVMIILRATRRMQFASDTEWPQKQKVIEGIRTEFGPAEDYR